MVSPDIVVSGEYYTFEDFHESDIPESGKNCPSISGIGVRFASVYA
jgi:hypothetical protein